MYPIRKTITGLEILRRELMENDTYQEAEESAADRLREHLAAAEANITRLKEQAAIINDAIKKLEG